MHFQQEGKAHQQFSYWGRYRDIAGPLTDKVTTDYMNTSKSFFAIRQGQNKPQIQGSTGAVALKTKNGFLQSDS